MWLIVPWVELHVPSCLHFCLLGPTHPLTLGTGPEHLLDVGPNPHVTRRVGFRVNKSVKKMVQIV